MQRFLEFQIRQSSVPNCGATWLSAFADEHITGPQAETIKFVVLVIHFQQVVGFDAAPANIDVAEVGQHSAGAMLGLIEHLPQLHFRDLSKRFHFPFRINSKCWLVGGEDLAGAVDDLLVALDLRHDPPLLLQRRQGDLESFEEAVVKALDGDAGFDAVSENLRAATF